jgi:hypothetical protein
MKRPKKDQLPPPAYNPIPAAAVGETIDLLNQMASASDARFRAPSPNPSSAYRFAANLLHIQGNGYVNMTEGIPSEAPEYSPIDGATVAESIRLLRQMASQAGEVEASEAYQFASYLLHVQGVGLVTDGKPNFPGWWDLAERDQDQN